MRAASRRQLPLRWRPLRRTFSASGSDNTPDCTASRGADDGAPPASTHFGFETVSSQEKTERVKGVFHEVAAQYDVMNDAMSGGVHRLWKRQLVAQLRPSAGMRVLDLAGGTGDIAFRVAEAAPGAALTVCDPTSSMLAEGQRRAEERGLRGIEWQEAPAETLPFADGAFDAVTMSFGMRNVTRVPQALREIRRVLAPGGRFMCLEFCMPQNAAAAQLYDAYSFNVIPRLGEAIVGDSAPYQYLVESIRQWDGAQPARFAGMLRDAGYGEVSFETQQPLGIVAIWSGWQFGPAVEA